MRPNLPVLLAAAAGLLCPPVFANDLATTCQTKLGPTEVDVVANASQPEGNYTLSYKELTQRSAPGNGASHTLGLTEGRFAYQASYGYTGLAIGDSGCVRPRIKITITLAPHILYVGREFRPGTCEFQHIYNHEARHVVTNHHHLNEVARRLKAEMQQHIGNTIYYGPPQQSLDKIAQQVRDVWIPRARAWQDLAIHSHALIDTPEEYARNNSVCDGAIARILRTTR